MQKLDLKLAPSLDSMYAVQVLPKFADFSLEWLEKVKVFNGGEVA